jgi:ferrochelatase
LKISSIVDIVGGVLQNKPAISFITQSHTNISKVKNGDLFFSSNATHILQAVQQGAFAIVYNCEIDKNMIDKEIAWIKVDNLDEAIIKFLRFDLSHKDIVSYHCDLISYEILSLLKNRYFKILFLNTDLKYNFELLQDFEDIDIVISTNKEFLHKIYPLTKQIVIKDYKIDNLIVHSLFQTTFSYKSKYFYRLKLSKIYINHFLTIINMFDIDTLDINYKFNRFKYMQPIFINKHNKIIDYGSSNRFIIANTNSTIIDTQIKFIEQYYKYGICKTIDGSCFDDMILEQIKNQTYNLLYIKNKTTQEILELLG